MSQQVATAIDVHGVLRDHKHVWFIAHSLGGILTKRMVTKWSGEGYDRYIHHIIGISLLGVPSNGSPLANLGDSAFGRLVGAWMGINARHVSDLKTPGTTNTFLQSLSNDWSNFFSGRQLDYNGFPRIYCAYETAAEYQVGNWLFNKRVEIVPEIYTKTDCDGEKTPINKTHTELPKPASSDDPIEDWLFRSARETFVRKQETGQEFNDANIPGALAELVQVINAGHRRTDRIGMPLVDELIAVTDPKIGAQLRLNGSRYVGSSWADVFERIAEDNQCVSVEISDLRRNRITVSFSGTSVAR